MEGLPEIRSEAHVGTLRGVAGYHTRPAPTVLPDSGLELPHVQSRRQNRNHANEARGGRATLSEGATRHRRCLGCSIVATWRWRNRASLRAEFLNFMMAEPDEIRAFDALLNIFLQE